MRSLLAVVLAALFVAFAAGAQQSSQLRSPSFDKDVIQGNPYRSPWTDYSASIASTGVAQALMPADPNRTGYFVQNQSAHTVTLNIPAAGGFTTHIQLLSNAYYESPWISVPTTAITITGTTGDAFAAAGW